jgi:hypothetical protein
MSHNPNHNPVLTNMRHLNSKYEQINAQQEDFMRRQSAGENPDPSEFTALLEKQSITGTAMAAQFSLLQKPLKTVITDSR